MNHTTETIHPYRVTFRNDRMEVRENPENGEQALYAIQAFHTGDIISSFSAKSTSVEPSYLTVQTGDEQHIMLWPEHLQYCNHSCAPNVFFDTTRMQVVALEDISAGTEMVFFYPSTEWSMKQPFACRCGNAACLGTIQGAMHIPQSVLSHYRLSDYILSKLRNR